MARCLFDFCTLERDEIDCKSVAVARNGMRRHRLAPGQRFFESKNRWPLNGPRESPVDDPSVGTEWPLDWLQPSQFPEMPFFSGLKKGTPRVIVAKSLEILLQLNKKSQEFLNFSGNPRKMDLHSQSKTISKGRVMARLVNGEEIFGSKQEKSRKEGAETLAERRRRR